METVTDFIFLGSKTLQMVTIAMKLKKKKKKSLLLVVGGGEYNKPIQHIKKQRCYFVSKSPYSQSYIFSGSQVWMWYLDHKEGWMPKN